MGFAAPIVVLTQTAPITAAVVAPVVKEADVNHYLTLLRRMLLAARHDLTRRPPVEIIDVPALHQIAAPISAITQPLKIAMSATFQIRFCSRGMGDCFVPWM